jgi:hypothetical protein
LYKSKKTPKLGVVIATVLSAISIGILSYFITTALGLPIPWTYTIAWLSGYSGQNMVGFVIIKIKEKFGIDLKS